MTESASLDVQDPLARFRQEFYLTPGQIYLQSQGVILLGLDVPSVDAIDSKDLPIHHALGRCGIAILESLALTDVPPGRYELICLPMKLVGADGAPVRALLKGMDREGGRIGLHA